MYILVFGEHAHYIDKHVGPMCFSVDRCNQPLTVKDEKTQVHYFNNIYNMRIFKNTITVRLDIKRVC